MVSAFAPVEVGENVAVIVQVAPAAIVALFEHVPPVMVN